MANELFSLKMKGSRQGLFMTMNKERFFDQRHSDLKELSTVRLKVGQLYTDLRDVYNAFPLTPR